MIEIHPNLYVGTQEDYELVVEAPRDLVRGARPGDPLPPPGGHLLTRWHGPGGSPGAVRRPPGKSACMLNP